MSLRPLVTSLHLLGTKMATTQSPLVSMFPINSTSLKYSKPSETDGSRLLLVCDVALGQCSDVHKRDRTLTQAPEGHHSVHGVRHTPNTHSEFEVGMFACERR